MSDTVNPRLQMVQPAVDAGQILGQRRQPFLDRHHAGFQIGHILSQEVDLAVELAQHFQDPVFRFGCHNLKLRAGAGCRKRAKKGYASPRHAPTSLGGGVDRNTAAGQ